MGTDCHGRRLTPPPTLAADEADLVLTGGEGPDLDLDGVDPLAVLRPCDPLSPVPLTGGIGNRAAKGTVADATRHFYLSCSAAASMDCGRKNPFAALHPEELFPRSDLPQARLKEVQQDLLGLNSRH